MTQKIVVWDPKNEIAEGTLVTDVQAMQLEPLGVALLPVVPRLFEASGVGGYAKRQWGPGVALSPHMPRLSCPLTIYAAKELRALHWCARLVPDGTGVVPNGQLRLTADGNQPGVLNASYQPNGNLITLGSLGKADAAGGWTVGGKGVVSPSGDGYVGFALYGTGSGIRVLFAAISQAEV